MGTCRGHEYRDARREGPLTALRPLLLGPLVIFPAEQSLNQRLDSRTGRVKVLSE